MKNELIIRLYTNESLSLDVFLKTKNDAGETVPLNISTAEFLCQVRDEAGALVTTLIVTLANGPAGSIVISLPIDTVKNLPTGKFLYNLVMLMSGVSTSLWTAPFIVSEGISQWP
jgi:hypothetical protein